MNNTIYPCLWCNNNALEMANFYCGVFKNSSIIVNTPMVVIFELDGKRVMGLNGGDMFTINPSISLFVTCETQEEIDGHYNKLKQDGNILMPLQPYEWSECYAWVSDRFGMSWQLMLDTELVGPQKLTTSLLFSGEQYGRGEEAIRHYASIFPYSTIVALEKYGENENQPQGKLKYGLCDINNERLAIMDGNGPHDFKFNEGVSIHVELSTQEEIDHYWNKLVEGGQESMCGWLKDKFGISWQIVPKILGELMVDPVRAPKVMNAVMKMKKINIEELVNA